MIWQTTRFTIALAEPRVMGIVNVTPDSFSDGGAHATPSAALAHCEKLLEEGADILDIGGESSRPGARPVGADEEWRRVRPVLADALTLGCPVSIDTMHAEVMRAALDIGVDIVNDINALRSPGALDEVAAHPSCGICLMHMRGEPRSMQADPVYGDVVAEVGASLAEHAQRLRERGVAAERIVLDPGIGFGKTVAHNFELLRRQAELLRLGHPLLVGWSRKSSLGAVTGRPAGDRPATVDALKVWRAAGLPRRSGTIEGSAQNALP
jgi:dihydropteroate synthase